MTCALDFTRQLALATGAVARLPTWLDLAAFVDVPKEHVQVFIVEAAPFGAIGGFAASPANASAPTGRAWASTATTAIGGTECSASFFTFCLFAHVSMSPLINGIQKSFGQDWLLVKMALA